MIKVCTRACWLVYWLAAAFFGLLAIIAIGLRLALPLVGEYREELADKLSGLLDQPVVIGDLDGGWSGMNPRISLADLRIGDGLLTLDSASVELDLPRSLLYLDPVFKHAKITRPVAHIDLNSQLESAVASENSSPEQSNTQPTLTTHINRAVETAHWILRQGDFQITQGQVYLQLPNSDYRIQGLSLDMQGDPDGSGAGHLGINAQLVHQDVISRLSAVAQTEKGGLLARSSEGYAEIEPVDLSSLLHALAPKSVDAVSQLAVSGRAWVNFDKRKLTQSRIELDVDDAAFNGFQPSSGQLVATLMPFGEGYQAQLTGFGVEHESESQAQSSDDSNTSLRQGEVYELPLIAANWSQDLFVLPELVAIEQIDLAALAGIFQGRSWLQGMGERALTQLKPRGEIQNINMRWLTPAFDSFELAADLNGVAVDSWSGAPAMGGITGRLEHTVKGGLVDLESSDFSMYVPDLGLPTWHASSALGRVGWAFTQDAITVSSGLLKAGVDGNNASGRFSLTMPFNEDEQAPLFLLIGVENGNGETLKQFIPAREVGEETHAWLVKALQGGHVSRGAFMLHAPTRWDLPGVQKPDAQIYVEAQDLGFSFDSQWPAIKGERGRFYFRDGHFTVEAQGKMLDSQVDWAWAHHKHGDDDLLIEGRAQGDAVDLYRVLNETPLKEQLDGAIGDWTWQGKATSALALTVPLNLSGDKGTDRLNPKVRVDVDLSDGQFWSEEQRITVDDLSGVITFDSEAGLSSGELKGRSFDEPLTASIVSEGLGKEQVTHIDITGAAKADSLRDWLSLPILGVMEGRTPFTTKLKITPDTRSLIVTSNLQGMTVNAPAPLGKTAEQARHLRLDLVGLGTASQNLWLSVDRAMKGRVAFSDEGVKAVNLHIAEQPEMPKDIPAGLSLSIDVDSTSLEELIGVVTTIESLHGDSQGEALNVNPMDVDIHRLLVGGLVYPSVKLGVTQQTSGWLLNVKSPDAVGNIRLFDEEQQPIQVVFERLRVPLDDTESSGGAGALKAETASSHSDIDPRDFPMFDVAINDLTVGDKPFGAWVFSTTRTESGIMAQNIAGRLHGFHATGVLSWQGPEFGNRTVVVGQFTGKNIGEPLTAWGIDELIESGQGKATAVVRWPGAPWEYETQQIDGQAQLNLDKGRLLETGQSGGFLRTLGLLNLENIGRRLRLDFSDLFQGGLTYDRIEADYHIRKGVLSTVTPFTLTGPSADIKMTGNVDINTETLDQQLQVILPVSKNLPLVGLLLGQPQVAAGVYLFDKLFGSQLEKATAISYQLTGPWKDPALSLSGQEAATSSP